MMFYYENTLKITLVLEDVQDQIVNTGEQYKMVVKIMSVFVAYFGKWEEKTIYLVRFKVYY